MNIDQGSPILFLALLTHCRSAKLAENKISGIDIKIGGNVLKVTKILNSGFRVILLRFIRIYRLSELIFLSPKVNQYLWLR